MQRLQRTGYVILLRSITHIRTHRQIELLLPQLGCRALRQALSEQRLHSSCCLHPQTRLAAVLIVAWLALLMRYKRWLEDWGAERG
mgnify:CR=1 FL=1